jgi:hypothetical protein
VDPQRPDLQLGNRVNATEQTIDCSNRQLPRRECTNSPRTTTPPLMTAPRPPKGSTIKWFEAVLAARSASTWARDLEDAGIISRHRYREVPPRHASSTP